MRRPHPETLRELEIRAEALRGASIGELARALSIPLPTDPRRSKGFLGTLLECALGADEDAGENPDFQRLGVELKTIPVRKDGVPAESTFVCSIKMEDADREHYESSRLCRRLARVLWVPIEAKSVASLASRRIGKPILWTPSPRDESELKADWELLMGAIGAGRGGTLSAREGVVLQVRPKASTARVRTLAPGQDGPEMMLPLGFYLRTHFTARILAGEGAFDVR